MPIKWNEVIQIDTEGEELEGVSTMDDTGVRLGKVTFTYESNDDGLQTIKDIHIELPEPSESYDVVYHSLKDIVEKLSPHSDVRGMKRLLFSLDNAAEHVIHVQKNMAQAARSIQTIHGVRSNAYKSADAQRSLQAKARTFFSALDERGLALQCDLFHIDAYGMKRKAVIRTLVEANTVMMHAQGSDNTSEE